MKPLRLLAAAALVSIANGCSSYNPLVALGIVNEPANKPTALAPIKASLAPRVAWTQSVGKAQDSIFRPAIFERRVYAIAADGQVSIMDEDTGRSMVKVDLKKRLAGGLEIGEGRVIVGTLKGEVIALDSAGKVQWTSVVNGEVIAPAAVSRKTVVVRTSDGRIFGLNLEDGKRKWVFQRASPALLLRSESGVLAMGQDVVAGYPNGKLIALDIEDGKLTWETTVTLPRGATELERIADVAGLPVVDGGNVCAAAFQSKVACFEIATRNLLWSRDLSSARALARDDRNIYAVDDASNVHALAKEGGASVWKQDKLRYRKLTAPLVFDRLVWVGDYQGFVHILAPDTGEIVGRIATDGSSISAMVPANGGVIVQTANGTVALIRN
ncbi:MAG: outer membrane protein assembly factor BamB [Burkholderiales bacterium]|nr:outer membrane protein assembly factor BamB [Burkholderiales bacterium]